MLEVRSMTTLIGSFIDDPLTAVLLVIVITLGLLVMQIKFKPFHETPEEAAHWSSANQMSVLGYVCTLAILVVGLASILCAPLGDIATLLLSLSALVALMVPLILTVIISTRGVDVDGGDQATEESESDQSDGVAAAEQGDSEEAMD